MLITESGSVARHDTRAASPSPARVIAARRKVHGVMRRKVRSFMRRNVRCNATQHGFASRRSLPHPQYKLGATQGQPLYLTLGFIY
ncbi:unnamed protein product [Parnassius apollo]|uniref:(apollo) hypothetical protein n=1 Tax=Parnassius apollo TaxID=110799 RepID=A0A8S3Y8E9_PARAO|nr:unnamed protein product [Parnassius apollo]